MPRKDDKVFKNLKKQKPLVKRKDITPLSSADFTPKKSKSVRTSVLSGTRAKPVLKKTQSRQAAQLAGRYHDVKNRPDSAKLKLEDAPSPKPKTQAPKPSAQITTEPTTKMRSTETEGLKFSAPSIPQPSIPRPSAASSMPRKQTSTAPQLKPKGLSYRHEIKYYINYRDYTVLSNALRAVMTLDQNAGDDRMYHIRSLYFDDMYESALYQKVNGTDDRYKFRIRIYNYSKKTIKFEKKIKKGQFIAKRSILISCSEYDQIISGDIDFLLDRKEALAREIYLEMKNNRLRPRVLIDYHREAYVAPFEDVRITFDKDLRGGLSLTDIFNPNTPTMPMFEKGMMVMEVKFNRYLPEYIKGVLQNINAANKSAISKYVICRRFD